MNDNGEEQPETNLLGELSELGNAIKPLFRRLPGVKRAIDRLTGGVAGAGAQALVSRLHLYRTENLAKEAQKVANSTGLPVPVIFKQLVRQRRIDELMVDSLRRVAENFDVHSEDGKRSAERGDKNTTNRWFEILYDEAATIEDGDVREGFVRILAGEIEHPGSFSLRTLRVMGTISSSTAQHFRRAASISIRLAPDREHIIDARIPDIGGSLGQNCLQSEGLSYDVLMDLTENGLIHSDYDCYYPYGPLKRPPESREQGLSLVPVPFAHQGSLWGLLPKPGAEIEVPMNVRGARLTSCGVELLRIVDIELLPNFTTKLIEYFSQSNYQMIRQS